LRYRINNGAHITGNAIHPAGTNISMGSGATVGADILADPQLPSLPAPPVFGA